MQPAAVRTAASARPGRAVADWALPRNVPIESREEAARAARRAAVFVAALLAIGLGHAWISTQARELEYDRAAVRDVVRRLEAESRDLEAQYESLIRNDRIERIAREQLGMVRPVAGQKRVLP